MAEVAVDRHPRRALPRPVETKRRQRPQRNPLLGQPLLDTEAAGRVQPTVADPVAPAGVLLVEPAQIGEAGAPARSRS